LGGGPIKGRGSRIRGEGGQLGVWKVEERGKGDKGNF